MAAFTLVLFSPLLRPQTSPAQAFQISQYYQQYNNLKVGLNMIKTIEVTHGS